jgi:hypothetical protein
MARRPNPSATFNAPKPAGNFKPALSASGTTAAQHCSFMIQTPIAGSIVAHYGADTPN